MTQGINSHFNPGATSVSMQSAGTSQYNDLLAQRQADVRSALQELYGTVHQHDNQEIGQEHQDSITHPINPVMVLDYGNDDTDVQSLSFDPLVLQDSDDGGDFHPQYNQIQNHNHNHGLDIAEHDGDSTGSGSSSVSSFSLSELCDGSIGLETHNPLLNATASVHHDVYAGNNLQIMQTANLQQKIDELNEENNHLQEELEMQKAEKALLSPTKYQVELDSMRIVAEQVQVEADEEIQILHREREIMSYELEQLKQQQQEQGQRQRQNIHTNTNTNQAVCPNEPNAGDNNGKMWECAFHSLLEQICLLEESGLRKDATLRMDHVIRDALVGIETESGLIVESSSLEESMGMSECLERLAKGCGSSNMLDSVVSREGKYEDGANDTNHLGTVASSIARDSHGSESQETGKYVSVGVDTDDLKSLGLFSPATSSANVSASISMTPFLQQTVSELQLENASLKGSNEHMKEQIVRYKQKVQSLKDSTAQNTSFVSPVFGARAGTHQYAQNENGLKQKSAQLQQEIYILTENQRVVEEENCNVVQRCVELENVAEDATRECEELIVKLAGAEDELEKLQDDREKLLTLHAAYEKATNKHELENHNFQDEMTNEFRALQDKCDGLIESSSVLEGEVDSLTRVKSKLTVELKDAKGSLEKKCKELNSLESQLLHIQEQQPDREDQVEVLKRECNTLKDEKIELKQQVKILQQRRQVSGDLEDECSRLRNLNGMIKAKIEMTEAELAKVKEENYKHVKKLTTIEADCDAMRCENVSLSDTKTDMEMEMKKYENGLADQKAVAARVELELGRTISMRDDLQKHNVKLREQLDELRKQSDAAKSSLKELQSENNTWKVTFAEERNKIVGGARGESRITNFTERKPFTSVEGRPNQTQSAGVQTPQTTSPGDFETPAPSSFRNVSFDAKSPSFTNTTMLRPAATMQSMDDQLERIKFAKERVMRTLNNVSNLQQKNSPLESTAKKSIPAKAYGKSRLDETEAFVKNILDSCGKQALSA